MRIVQVCPYSWQAPGGVQAHVRQLAAHLMRRGHQVLILAPGDGSPVEPHVRTVGRPLRVRFNGSIAPLCLYPWSAWPVRDALRRFAPDVVHVHEPLAPSTSMLAVLHANAPLVATFHAYYGPDTVHAHLLSAAAPVLRPIWNRLDLRLAVSAAAASCVGSRMGEDAPRVVPNGVNVDLFASATPAPLPPGRRLLFVGRLEPRKGFTVAVRAFAELAPRFPDLHFVVVGDGADRDALDELEPSVRERVLMLGRVSNAALPTYYAAADVFVAPATGRESFGIVLVEAMAAGLPIVASDLPGYCEVVRPHVDGLVVPPSDPAATAQAVASLLDRPSVARRLGHAGRARARTFSWQTVATRLEAAYEEALGLSRVPTVQLGRRAIVGYARP